MLHLAPPPAPAAGDERWWLDTRTTALLRALRLRSLPRSLVYASTSGVYGDCQGQWVSETRSVAPTTARAQRRVNAELAVRFAGRSGLRTSLLRIPGIYAPDREGGTPAPGCSVAPPCCSPKTMSIPTIFMPMTWRVPACLRCGVARRSASITPATTRS